MSALFLHRKFVFLLMLLGINTLDASTFRIPPDSQEAVLELFFIAKDEVDPFTEGEYIRLTYRNSSGKKVRLRGTLQDVRGDSFQIDETWISVASVHRISGPSKRFRKHPEGSNKKLVMFPLFLVPLCLFLIGFLIVIEFLKLPLFDNDFSVKSMSLMLGFLFLTFWAGPIATTIFGGYKLRVVKERQLRTSSPHKGQEP